MVTYFTSFDDKTLTNFNFNMFSAIGAGQSHHSELSDDIYKDPKTKIYIDNWASAKTELATLNATIVGEVGDIINGHSTAPSTGITIFQSMGKKNKIKTNIQ